MKTKETILRSHTGRLKLLTELGLLKGVLEAMEEYANQTRPPHPIYYLADGGIVVTSDEEVKNGDYVYSEHEVYGSGGVGNILFQFDNRIIYNTDFGHKLKLGKVILATPKLEGVTLLVMEEKKDTGFFGSNLFTDDEVEDIILKKFHGYTKKQWKEELVKQYPYMELPALVRYAALSYIEKQSANPARWTDEEMRKALLELSRLQLRGIKDIYFDKIISSLRPKPKQVLIDPSLLGEESYTVRNSDLIYG